MSASNRAAVIQKCHKVLRKHYQAVSPPERSVLEHLHYACCLENAPYEKADEAFARVQATYFEWNEVRVTSVSELAEEMAALPDPQVAVTNLKRLLQSVFEAYYDWDYLETLKKQNLGKAVADLQKHAGVSPFVLAYGTQAALGGHSIPLDRGALEVLLILGLINEKEAAAANCPGLERAIPKNKGVEFGSLLHQLGADLLASPYSPQVRAILLEIEPEAKDRLPKRSRKGSDEAEAAEPEPKAKPAAEPAAPKKKAAKKKPAAETPKPKKKAATKKSSGAKKSATKKLTKKKPK